MHHLAPAPQAFLTQGQGKDMQCMLQSTPRHPTYVGCMHVIKACTPFHFTWLSANVTGSAPIQANSFGNA